MNWPLILIGSFLIVVNVREGAKRKLQGDSYWMAHKAPMHRDILMTLLLAITIVGIAVILFSGGSLLRNGLIALLVLFVIAPSIAGFTTTNPRSARKIVKQTLKENKK